MPSYLTCWSIGRYDHLEGKSKGGVPVRVYTPVGKSEEGKLALHVRQNGLKTENKRVFNLTTFQVATEALDYYREFFGLGYSLPKMDLIAIPDFAIGAMENWGLLTFRESFLLASEASSAHAKQWVALIVAHEVAHQVREEGDYNGFALGVNLILSLLSSSGSAIW